MDVDTIRSRFIQENLRRALQEQDQARAVLALHAFQIYFQWFENRLPAVEKLIIVSQLARLEMLSARGDSGNRASEPLPD